MLAEENINKVECLDFAPSPRHRRGAMTDPDPTDAPSHAEGLAASSPVVPVAVSVFLMAFGAVFMAGGGLMFWGLTQGLEEGWQRALTRNGFGTPAQLAESARARVDLAAALAAFQVRDAERRKLARGQLPPEAQGDEAALDEAVEVLREEASDWEPGPAPEVLRPLPEGRWGRFAALTTDQRTKLFAGPMAAPVFFMPGLFIALAAFVSMVRERGARRLAREFPERPWLHVSEWSRLRGRGQGGGARTGLSLMSFVFGWVALCASVMWIAEPEPEGAFTALTAAVDGVTVLLGLFTVRAYVQGFKFGQAALLLGQVPLEPGKTFAARLVVPAVLSTATKVSARLHLEKSYTTGQGKNRHAHSVTVYEQLQEVPRTALLGQGGTLSVDLRFELPDDQPTNHAGSEPGYQWKVAVSAETPGVDFSETFELPVYRPRGSGDLTVRSDWQG